MWFLIGLIIIILASRAWNDEHKSIREADRIMREDPDFRDTPGNKYYKPNV